GKDNCKSPRQPNALLRRQAQRHGLADLKIVAAGAGAPFAVAEIDDVIDDLAEKDAVDDLALEHVGGVRWRGAAVAERDVLRPRRDQRVGAGGDRLGEAAA